MSYLGLPPTSAAFVTDTFSGTGSQTDFTMSVAPASTTSMLVVAGGVLQDPANYAIVGMTLRFSTAPPAGTGNISVRYLGIPASGVVNTAYRTVSDFTATAGQTVFTVPSYTIGFIDVFRNGARLGTDDFTANNGTSITLAKACNALDLVTTVSFSVASVLNGIQAIPNAVIDSYINTVSASKLTGSRTLPQGVLPQGSILQAVQAEKTDVFATGSTSYVDVSGLSVTITPASINSRFLILGQIALGSTTVDRSSVFGRLMRNGNPIHIADTSASTRDRGTFSYQMGGFEGPMMQPIVFIDSPASSYAVTYNIQIKAESPQTAYINRGLEADGDSPITPRTSSSLVIMEIAA